MSAGVGIWRCKSCGTAVFPQRLLCPHCHGAAFDAERVHEGVIEEVAVIRHMIGHANWQPRRIANVRTEAGPSITVGLRDESDPRTVVELEQDEGAPYGKARALKESPIKSREIPAPASGLIQPKGPPASEDPG